LARTLDEALSWARSIGYPVALKVESPDIAHKTEAGVLKLAIRDEEELKEAYQKLMDNARRHKPQAKILGVLVQEMAAPGTEVIVGMTRDPQIGPAILFGLGGIFVEVMKDVSLRVLPILRHEADEMVREIKASRILEGYRGKPPVDLDAIKSILLKVAQLSAELGPLISELDINPIIVLEKGKGAIAVDALMSVRMETAQAKR
ncbi:MAG: acetate--CoA ligase family protein, partial [candidate division WOR-3 bacterium]